MTKILASAACAATLLLAPAAFAQSAGTSLTGTSNGAQGTPGHSSPSAPSSDQRGPGTANTTATGGNAGGNASKN